MDTPEPDPKCARPGGRKRGSLITCDEALIRRLLPLGTRDFNTEVKALDLAGDEVRKLKVTRRRIKNAKAAEKRRAKVSQGTRALERRVESLILENADLRRRLALALGDQKRKH